VLTFLRWLRHALRRAHDGVIGANLAQQRRLVKQGRMTIGQHTYGIPVIKTYDHDTTKLIVGAYSALSEEAIVMLGGEHAIDRVTTYRTPARTASRFRPATPGSAATCG
jgi:hypothetical protein